MKGDTSEDAYRTEALSALRADDWHGAYRWAKGWIGQGGGAWIVDPWLVYAASALMNGQPKTAVHSIDLALRSWIAEPADRAILRWVRACVIQVRLKDPKTALLDFEDARAHAPDWLRAAVDASRERCAAEASASRKRKPAVGKAPVHAGPQSVHGTVAPPGSAREPGLRPPVWDAVAKKMGLLALE
jgi:hypothetical protein